MKFRNPKIIVYRVFDIAEEVELRKAEELLRTRIRENPGRLELKMKGQQAVIIREAPVRFSLGLESLPELESKLPPPRLSATLWNYGALSISYQFDLGATATQDDFFRYSVLLNEDEKLIQALNENAKAKAGEVILMLRDALQKPQIWNEFEDYIIYLSDGTDENWTSEQLIDDGDVPEIIMGEPEHELAPDIRARLLENTFQYGNDDLCVIDWNSAFVLEPASQSDVLDVLEFSLSHQLELRFYDHLIDSRLQQLYTSLEEDRKRFPLVKILRGSFSQVAEEASSTYLELSEFTERMGNSLKAIGDFYLARIFRAALQRFRTRDWEESIGRKMDLLSKIPTLLQNEVNTRRGHLLEIIIILLIAYEIIMAYVR